LFQSILPSNDQHLDRAVEMVFAPAKRKWHAGMSFKAATDDLRESPGALVKRLLVKPADSHLDDNVSLGHLIGQRSTSRKFIPHIGSLLSASLSEYQGREVVVIATTDLHAPLLPQIPS